MSVSTQSRNQEIIFPIEPYRRWVERLLEEQRARGVKNPTARTASLLGVSGRRLYLWRFEETHITETEVDCAVTHEGRYSIRDIYVDEGPSNVVLLRPRTPEPQCASRGCEKYAVGRFCPEHKEQLARVRADYKADSARMHRHGGDPRSNDRTSGIKQPTCCNPHCWLPRHVGEAFCEDCQAEGWVEELEE